MKAVSEAGMVMLRVIDRFGGEGAGWAEIVLQFSFARGLPDNLEGAIVDVVAKALARRGLIVDAADGPTLTDAGRAALGAAC